MCRLEGGLEGGACVYEGIPGQGAECALRRGCNEIAMNMQLGVQSSACRPPEESVWQRRLFAVVERIATCGGQSCGQRHLSGVFNASSREHPLVF